LGQCRQVPPNLSQCSDTIGRILFQKKNAASNQLMRIYNSRASRLTSKGHQKRQVFIKGDKRLSKEGGGEQWKVVLGVNGVMVRGANAKGGRGADATSARL
jgi:hypothetical protein